MHRRPGGAPRRFLKTNLPIDMPTTEAAQSPTLAARDEGQSLWLDYIRRSLMTSGQLRRLIDEDALRGLTSNPSIFQKAIGGSDEYDEAIESMLEADSSLDARGLYERLAVEDIQRAADVLRPVYDETGIDGVVSLEVDPHLARDTEGTIEEARRLWTAVDRPNLMIKVPATEAGIPAIEQLLSEGINVNVTLMFSLTSPSCSRSTTTRRWPGPTCAASGRPTTRAASCRWRPSS